MTFSIMVLLISYTNDDLIIKLISHCFVIDRQSIKQLITVALDWIFPDLKNIFLNFLNVRY